MWRSAKNTSCDALVTRFSRILQLTAGAVWQYCIPFEKLHLLTLSRSPVKEWVKYCNLRHWCRSSLYVHEGERLHSSDTCFRFLSPQENVVKYTYRRL